MTSDRREGRDVNETAGVGQVRVGEPGPGPTQTETRHGASAPERIEPGGRTEAAAPASAKPETGPEPELEPGPKATRPARPSSRRR